MVSANSKAPPNSQSEEQLAKTKHYIYVHKNSSMENALFTAIKALSDKQAIVVAPDSRNAQKLSQISVLGRPFYVASGSALMAYESNCQVFWLDVLKEEEMLIPKIVAGPEKLPNEGFGAYKKRFLEFYQKMLSDQMTGDPCSMAPSTRLLQFRGQK
jgi:hypothetical protein